MKLSEFYNLSEGHDSYYTVEPDGRLLEWDQAMISDDHELFEETSYEVIAHGNNGVLIEELNKRIGLKPGEIDRIEFGLSMGCQVTVLKEGNEVKVRL
jgi:hypothetical protein